MSEALEFLIRYGAIVLFAAVFLEQIGVPLPAAPWLLAAGALAGAGKMNGLVAIVVAIVASLLADLIWFYLGRHYGSRVLGILCRISLEPDSCVRKTSNLFTRYGLPGLIPAKFIPGLGTLGPPLAGYSGASIPQFLLFDGVSALLHEGCFILLGVLFSRQLQQILDALGRMGGDAVAVLAGLAALYIGYKYFQRQRLLHELKMARITVKELRQKLDAGESIVILDVRSHDEVASEPALIGALHMTLDEVEHRLAEIPRDRDIVLYCSCPNEVTAARVAMLLRRKGLSRVRPLLGGIDAWRERNYPVTPRPVAAG